MTDDLDLADSTSDANEKLSKRDRWRSALAKTKDKLHKHNHRSDQQPDRDVDKLSDDVDDFLASGKPSTTYTRPSVADSRHDVSARPSTSDALPKTPASIPRQSPRRVVVPRIDVTGSKRWPSAKQVEEFSMNNGGDFLKPEHYERSVSSSSVAKRREHTRGLSVSFIDAPPIIIGEGGDRAQHPTMEISRAKVRARSVSPTALRMTPGATSPVRLQHVQAINKAEYRDETFVRKPLRRAQTGMAGGLDEEFERSLQLGSLSNSGRTPTGSASHGNVPLFSPQPKRPGELAAVIHSPISKSFDPDVPSRDQSSNDTAAPQLDRRPSPGNRTAQSPQHILRKPVSPNFQHQVSPSQSPRLFTKSSMESTKAISNGQNASRDGDPPAGYI